MVEKGRGTNAYGEKILMIKKKLKLKKRKPKKYILGVDPGKKGAFVLIDSEKQIITWTKMPLIKREYDLRNIACALKHAREYDCMVYLEFCNSFGKGGKKSFYVQGIGHGIIRGMLFALELRYREVSPSMWQKVIYAGMPKNLQPKEKAQLVFSQEYQLDKDREFPVAKASQEGLIDAFLIAQYGLHQERF